VNKYIRTSALAAIEESLVGWGEGMGTTLLNHIYGPMGGLPIQNQEGLTIN
jgi:hypothetical protein